MKRRRFFAVCLSLVLLSGGISCRTPLAGPSSQAAELSSPSNGCPVSLDLLADTSAAKQDTLSTRGAGPAEIQAAQATGNDGHVAVDVFYGTNRVRTGDCHPDRIYGGDEGTLEFGRVRVTIPQDHRLGELETPSILRLELAPDPERHVVLTLVRPIAKKYFHQQLASSVARSEKPEVFVFIHGFNVPFEEAARRSAQVAYDLKFPGVPVLFSWPSEGRVTSYVRDRSVAKASGPVLADFLREVTRGSGAETVHLIAHSMGAHVLGFALREMAFSGSATEPAFQEIVLAAPDVDAREFEVELAQVLANAGQRVTLYASARDRALQMARDVLGFRRVGDTTDGIVIHERIETVDATNVDTSFFGHSYYGENRSVMSDLFVLLRERQSAGTRFGLVPVETARGTYWRFHR